MFHFHRLTKKRLRYGMLFLALLIAPLLLQQTSYSYVIRIGGIMGLTMLVALGLNICLGFLGLLDLGFMAFYAIGAYSMALLACQGFGFWISLALSILFTMLVRGIIGAPVLRLQGDYLSIVTLGFGEITRIILNNWDSVTNGPKGISLLTNPNVKPVRLFSYPLNSPIHYYYLIFVFVCIAIVLSVRLMNSRLGRAWMAIREDEIAARLTGINITRMKMIGFVISAAFAGAAGALFVRWENFVTPESFTFWESVMLVAMVVIGGMGSIAGTCAGVALLILIPEVLRNCLSSGFESWRYLLFGMCLVLVAVFRPQGLFRRARSS